MGNGILRRSPNAGESVGLHATHMVIAVKQTDIPEGRCLLFAGANMGSNGNTCPLLAVYTWDKNIGVGAGEHGELAGIGGPGGGQLDKARTTILKEFTEAKVFMVDVNQTIEMVPIEDIISIDVVTDLKKKAHQKMEMSLVEKPPEELTCCEKVTKCCKENVCCCCNQEMQEPAEYRQKSTVRLTAERKIVVLIERVRHGLLNTPSNVRLLSQEKQNKFYHDRLDTEEIIFYYMNNTKVDEKEYKDAIQACETLARIVMQLKGMIGHYPDEAQLKKIVEQEATTNFGQEVSEDIDALTNTSNNLSIRQDTTVSLRS